MSYFPPPESLPVIPIDVYGFLCVTATLATFSVLATSGTLIAVAIHYFRGHRNHADQLLLPILQLLFVDFIQAFGLSLSWNWARTSRILAPTVLCSLQGALINFGDVTNALCILFIALETVYRFKYRRRPSRCVDYSVALGIFAVGFITAIVGPIQHGKKYYVRTSTVCWVSQSYQLERLLLHYLYIFLAQFGTLVVYSYLIVILLMQRARIRREMSGSTSSSRAMKRAACYMAIYPAVSLVLWFPLELFRMMTWAGHGVPDTYLFIGGALISCVGWVNAIVYIVTRHVFQPEHNGSSIAVGMRPEPASVIRRPSAHRSETHPSMINQFKQQNRSATDTLEGGREGEGEGMI